MRTVLPLMEQWRFIKGDQPCPVSLPAEWETVTLPHTWNGADGQDGGGDYYRGPAWYVRELDRDTLPGSTAHCFLEICGASASAQVYLNGALLARHDGGYSTFRVELTPALREKNLLAIRVDNGVSDTVYPQMADFTFYGGLYRPVSLICTGEDSFDLLYWGTSGVQVSAEASGQVHFQARVKSHTPWQIRWSVCDAENRQVVSALTDGQDHITLTVPEPHLWNGRQDPYLYTASAELLCQGNPVDKVSHRIGFRSVAIDPQRGFLLNGREYPLRGVSRHQDRPGIGNALLPEHHREDADLICELGANAVRLAHYQHDAYFYDLCDERGLVVWAEIPMISQFLPAGVDNTLSQMRELVLQNLQHPCIAVWGLSNEITVGGDPGEPLVENHRQLNTLCHELDPSRPTVVAAVSMCPMDSPYLRVPDAVAYNHYFGWYGGELSMYGEWFDRFHALYPDIPIGCSEYGCEALNWHTSTPEAGDYTEEYQAAYYEAVLPQLFSRQYLWAAFAWNMFDFGADTRNEGGENGQNHKGLMTFDRKYKKDAFYACKAWMSDEPFVHLCGKRYEKRVESPTKVTVYSNLPEVELWADGTRIGVQRSENHVFCFEVPNDRPETHLTARAGSCTDESCLRHVDTFPEEYRLKEAGAILNWFDLTAPEGKYSLNDRLRDLMANPRAAKAVKEFLKGPMQVLGKSEEEQDHLLNQMESFTLLRMSTLMSQMLPKEDRLTADQMLACNRELNQINRE